MVRLEEDIRGYPDPYQYERAVRLGVSQNAIFYALKKRRISYKKMSTHPRADEDKRHGFEAKHAAYEEAGRTLVWIDESGFAHDIPCTPWLRTYQSAL